MRVSRTQAEANRQTVITVASKLFREHGFDGIGLRDVMDGAGLTQGAFYKQFRSKEDLAAQATRDALDQALRRWTSAADQNPQDPLSEVVKFYLSDAHRKQRREGCPIVALGSDAARQGPEVKASLEAGIVEFLGKLAGWLEARDGGDADAKAMAVLSTMVGAVLLARSVNDEALAATILTSAADNVLAATGSQDARQGDHS